MNFRSAFFLSLGLVLVAQVAPDRTAKEVIPVTDAYPDDPALAKVIEPLKAHQLATFGKVIGHAPEGLFRASGTQPGLLGYWVVDAMRARAEAIVGAPVKFGYTNTGGLRANIRPGAVKVEDIYLVMPFENELMVTELTGAEVLDVVKESLVKRSVEPLSGVRIATGGTADKPELVITWSDGSPIDPKEVVKLATSDYLVSSSYALRKARNSFATGITLRQVLLDLCAASEAKGKPLVASQQDRLQITPAHLELLKTQK